MRVNFDDDKMGLDVSEINGQDSVEGYVLSITEEWRSFAESNFYSQWDEFYRLWRGIWASEDKTRDSERSRIITPALQQAVESSVSEIEEATFGHGKLFDLRDDMADTMAPTQEGKPPEDADIAFLKKKLTEEFERNRIRRDASEVLLNAAVYGTGVAEVVMEEQKRLAPAKEPILNGQLAAIGVNMTTEVAVIMKPIQMKNFLIDPVATSIENAHGCAIDEFVPAHTITELQEQGVYRKCHVGTAPSEHDLEPNPEISVVPHHDKVRLLKYFGLVPRHLIKDYAEYDELDSDDGLDSTVVPLNAEVETEDESYWVEAIVVIANEGVVLKVEENPYMMQDRPIVAFAWDTVPGMFWGRGVCEKGYNSQKALDTEIRARIDALALTVHPMMAMDATRIPRGHTPTIRAGKMILTTGKPQDALMPFNFGQVSQITFAQAGELQRMVQQSTGAVDSSGIGGTVNSEATAAGISMSLGAIIKRQKRTLLNFQENFWLPFVTKAAWRYMQFNPDAFPVKDYKFMPTSTLGIMAREYEVSQLVQLLQTTSDQSPMYGPLVQSIVENMNINNRDELIAILEKSAQPSPEQTQKEEEAHAKAMALQDAQIAAVNAQAAESNARAQKYTVEASVEPEKLEISKMEAITRNLQPGAEEDKEFGRRLQLAELYLKEKAITSKSAGNT